MFAKKVEFTFKLHLLPEHLGPLPLEKHIDGSIDWRLGCYNWQMLPIPIGKWQKGKNILIG